MSMIRAEAKREVCDLHGKLLCAYSGGDVPRRGEPFTITTQDVDGRRTMKTYEVIAVLWSVTCHGSAAEQPQDQWEPYHHHNAGDALSLPLATIQVAERDKL